VLKVIVASSVACGLVTAAIALAGESAAECDAAECVPNVARNVVEGAPCPPRRSFVFGLDSAGGTLICAAQGTWVRVGPLVGERELALPCDKLGDTAQQPLAGNDLQPRTPGIPLQCAEINSTLRWAHF
jgi:hypothetical protein